MSNSMTLDYEGASRAIREIVENIGNLVTAATVFRGEVEDSFDNYKLTFLRNVSSVMGQLESASKQLQATFLEIQDGLRAYTREFEEFESEGGLR